MLLFLTTNMAAATSRANQQLIKKLFTEEILRIKAFAKSGTYFQLIMHNLTLNKVFSL